MADPDRKTSSDPHGTAERLADALSRTGAAVVFRRQTKGPGPAGLINPPRVMAVVLAAAAAAGATTLQLTAAQASGRLIMGDILQVAGQELHVVAECPALPPSGPAGFAAVAILPAIGAALPLGTPVSFVFGADVAVYARIASFSRRLVDGERIRSRDLNLLVSSWGLGEILTGAWSVIVDGREMAIEDAMPSYEGGTVVSWSVQAR